MSAIEIKTVPVDGAVEPGDHDRFSHYVRGDGVHSARDIVFAAMIEGTPIVAICGKTWVPSRDPERFPMCPRCKEISGR